MSLEGDLELNTGEIDEPSGFYNDEYDSDSAMTLSPGPQTLDTAVGDPVNGAMGTSNTDPTAAMDPLANTMTDAPTVPVKDTHANETFPLMNEATDVVPTVEVIEEGVNTFFEALPALIVALDAVEKIHPFISGTRQFF